MTRKKDREKESICKLRQPATMSEVCEAVFGKQKVVEQDPEYDPKHWGKDRNEPNH